MKTAGTKDLSYYENLPYTITLRKDDQGDYVARVEELPGCIAHGDDEASAIAALRSVQKLWLEDALEAGDKIPEPESVAELPSGKWLQRAPGICTGCRAVFLPGPYFMRRIKRHLNDGWHNHDAVRLIQSWQKNSGSSARVSDDSRNAR